MQRKAGRLQGLWARWRQPCTATITVTNPKTHSDRLTKKTTLPQICPSPLPPPAINPPKLQHVAHPQTLAPALAQQALSSSRGSDVFNCFRPCVFVHSAMLCLTWPLSLFRQTPTWVPTLAICYPPICPLTISFFLLPFPVRYSMWRSWSGRLGLLQVSFPPFLS